MKLAIIGAGAAGLAAAHRLRQQHPQIETTIYEKSRGVGGRAASRRINGALFDHGAQYIKDASSEVDHLLRETLPYDTLVSIDRPVWTFNGAGMIHEGDPDRQEAYKWTYTDGITRFAKELARGLDLRAETRIGRLQHNEHGYAIFNDQADLIDQADAVLLTPPAPQTSDLIDASDLPSDGKARLLAELANARYRRCLTLTLGYPPITRDRPFYALVNTDKQHPISWLAYEHTKPGRPMADQHVLIAQMAPDWSAAHWDDDLDTATAHVAGLASDVLGEDLRTPAWANRQGWRYSQPDGGADFDRLNSTLDQLYFAGDYTAGQGRVHLAIEQGWRIAELIGTAIRSS